jgi:tetratricopeptide (TPR) repeat protein
MKFFVVSLVFAFAASAQLAVAQDDEARAASGLPQMIGRRGCNNSVLGADGTVVGSVGILGAVEGDKQPVLSVALFANGVFVARERLKSRSGSFSFSCVPKLGVALVVESDGMEIGNYPLGTLNPAPLSTRIDVQVTAAQLREPKARKENSLIRDLHPRTAENQKAFEKASASLREKKNGNSIKLFSQIVAADPEDFVAWTELGNLYFSDEKYSDAEAAYGKAIALKPDFVPALLNFGKLYIKEKKADQAVETLSKAVAIMPDSADVNHYLGEAYLQAKKGSKAVGYLNRAIELAPTEKAEIHLRLATLYNAAGAKDLAAAEYRSFLQKVPDYKEKAALEKYISENTKK